MGCTSSKPRTVPQSEVASNSVPERMESSHNGHSQVASSSSGMADASNNAASIQHSQEQHKANQEANSLHAVSSKQSDPAVENRDTASEHEEEQSHNVEMTEIPDSKEEQRSQTEEMNVEEKASSKDVSHAQYEQQVDHEKEPEVIADASNNGISPSTTGMSSPKEHASSKQSPSPPTGASDNSSSFKSHRPPKLNPKKSPLTQYNDTADLKHNYMSPVSFDSDSNEDEDPGSSSVPPFMHKDESLYNFESSSQPSPVRIAGTSKKQKSDSFGIPSLSDHVFNGRSDKKKKSPNAAGKANTDQELDDLLEEMSDLASVSNDPIDDLSEDARSPLEKIAALSPSARLSSATPGKCGIVYLGTSQSEQRGEKRCSSMHCINCDFHVSCFDNHKWHSMSSEDENQNYLFFRNNYPETIHERLEPKHGWSAYCCQCIWDETDCQKRPKTRRWVCTGHKST